MRGVAVEGRGLRGVAVCGPGQRRAGRVRGGAGGRGDWAESWRAGQSRGGACGEEGRAAEGGLLAGPAVPAVPAGSRPGRADTARHPRPGSLESGGRGGGKDPDPPLPRGTSRRAAPSARRTRPWITCWPQRRPGRREAVRDALRVGRRVPGGLVAPGPRAVQAPHPDLAPLSARTRLTSARPGSRTKAGRAGEVSAGSAVAPGPVPSFPWDRKPALPEAGLPAEKGGRGRKRRGQGERHVLFTPH